MQDKLEHFEYFNQLPNVIKGEITKFLPTKEFLALSMTSKSNHNLFKTNQQLALLQEARKFLHQVVRGNHEAVAEMLKKNPSLMHIRGQVTDLSGRKFTNISGFKYAMWALDKHMWTTMLHCLPETKEGEKIKSVLNTQYQEIKEDGVTYELHSVIMQKPEKHFDFESTIIKELQEYVDKGDKTQWQTGVGGAQKLLPMHVVYEYCSDTPFYPESTFEKQPESSNIFYNALNDKMESWFRESSKLGIDFAIYKGRGHGAWGSAGTRAAERGACRSNLNVIKALYKVRTKDFLALENDLKPCNLPEHQYKN